MSNPKISKLKLALEKLKELELIKNLAGNLSTDESKLLSEEIKKIINNLRTSNI